MIRPSGDWPQTAKDDLDGRVQALLSAELLRYHQVLDRLQVDAEQADRLRQAAIAVQRARADGLPSSEVESPALSAVEERRAIEAPTVTQIPVFPARPQDEIVDAELVDAPREEFR